MPNQPIVTAGLVLRETVTRETDKILTVLTPDRGRSPSLHGAPGGKTAVWRRRVSCWPIRN